MTSSRANAAILFEFSSYDSDQKLVKGRHVAGASFLEGFVRHASVDRYVGIGFRGSDAPHFKRQVATITAGDPALSARPVHALGMRQLEAVGKIGTLFIPDPQVARFAAMRRTHGQRAYSLCGVTHTIASVEVMAVLSDLLTAPIQSWDALICTSQSVRDAVLRQQEYYADYLEERIGVRPASPAQTPVIPLGVDADRFERLGSDAAARTALRERLGAAEQDVVVLFFGRLAFHAKGHPVPMYLGAQRAARRLGAEHGRIHLVQTGQFPSPAAEDTYRQGAARYCPDVVTHFLDGSDRELSDASWAAADVFVSLSDNIQESFGITPIEAMAAGLPCLVSDWDGYRDTVVQGETGIRIPTWMPTAGNGAALAEAYGAGNMNYDLYIGYASQMTVVEVPAIADALETLVRDRAMRERMGEAGRRRVRERYDWSVVIREYQALWQELADRRRVDNEIAPPRQEARNPRLADPFGVFGAHASTSLRNACILRADPEAPTLESLTALPGNVFAANALLEQAETDDLVRLIGERDEVSVGSLLEGIPPARRVRAVRTLAWLAKYGIIALGPETGGTE